jgi:DHA1 family multidrug resistance protein-like MFS transporter
LRVWRRNLAAITGAVFIGFTGFTLVMPFLPLYLGELGLRDVGDVAFWAGISLGITPAVTALMAPFWGRIADRVGRKLMVARSLGSFVVLMAAMAFVTEPWHVFALRLVQGFFAGYGPLALSMAAESSPPDRLATSLGTVQTAQRLGPAVGPVIGGAVAQMVGLRNAFLVSSLVYLAGVVIVFVLYEELPRARGGTRSQGSDGRSAETAQTVTFRNVLAFENFVLLMGVIFGLQLVERSFGPILPLHLAAIGVPMGNVPVVSGIMFSLLGLAGATGNTTGAVLLKRLTAKTVIQSGAIAAAVAAIAFALVPAVPVLYAAAALLGVSIGVSMTAAFTAGSVVIPEEARATGFGFLTSAYLAALAISPMIAGLVSRQSMVGVFIVDAIVLAAVAAVVTRVMAERAERAEAPVAEEV